MKRVKAACLEQTLHFQLKDEVELEKARQLVRDEYKSYKAKMDCFQTRYEITSESEQPDGSLIIKIKKQVSPYPVGDYFD